MTPSSVEAQLAVGVHTSGSIDVIANSRVEKLIFRKVSFPSAQTRVKAVSFERNLTPYTAHCVSV